MNLKLVPLRIPNRWAVLNNHFVDEDPIVENDTIVNNFYYKEDILRFESMSPEDPEWTTDPEGHVLDLGWYPDSDPNGIFRLLLGRKPAKGATESKDIVEISSRNRDTIRQALEHCMVLILDGIADKQIASVLTTIFSKSGKLSTGKNDKNFPTIKALF